MNEGGYDGPKQPPQPEGGARFVVPSSGPPEDRSIGEEEALKQEQNAKKNHLKNIRELLADGKYEQALKATLPEGIDKDEIVQEALPLFEAFAPILKKEYDKVSDDPNVAELDEASREKIQKLFNIVLLAGEKTDEAKAVLDSIKEKDITPAQREAILTQISKKDKSFKDQEEALPEAEQMQQEVTSLHDQMNAGMERLQELGEGAEPDESEAPEGLSEKGRVFISAQVRRLQGRIANYKDRFDHFVNVPPSEWVRRGGKMLYIAAVVCFLLILLEMTLIHKAAARK